MIVLLSPSKSMDMASANVVEATQPAFLAQSEKLVAALRKLSTTDLMEFMDISEKLADLNRQRFTTWQTPFSLDNAKQAVLAFTGDVYDGLNAATFDPQDLRFAQERIRILSGLYGLLRPLDLIQPYRLEMGRPLATQDTRNLYEFWKTEITEELNETKGDVVINLASQEYFKVVDKRALNKQVVSPVFKDEKNGKFKIISFYAKKARGIMARYIIENRITRIDDLLGFTEAGYAYHSELSTPQAPVFTRPEQ
jgi:cytoplasmic iron level regulating protein YaaA (DUF328/UPF0246 family)